MIRHLRLILALCSFAVLACCTLQSSPAQNVDVLRRLPSIEPTAPPFPPLPATVPPPESLGPAGTLPADAVIVQEIAPPPTDEIVMHDPWYYPGAWYDPKVWSGSFEVGINGSEGNSQTLSTRTGANLESKTENRELTVKLVYARTASNSIETQHNAILDAEHDWLFKDSRWSIFAKGGLVYDEFKAFDLRLNANAGWGYKILKSDTTNLTGRFGAGVSREFGGPDDSWVPEAVFGMDYQHQISKRQKLVVKFDYFPEWGDFMDYRINLDSGWELLIDEEKNLSLKVSLIDRYDSTPNGAKHNDVDYALLLLWKL